MALWQSCFRCLHGHIFIKMFRPLKLAKWPSRLRAVAVCASRLGAVATLAPLFPNRRSRLRPVAVCASRRGPVATFGLPSPNRRSRLRAVVVCASRRGPVAALAPPGRKPALSPASRCCLCFSSRPRGRCGLPPAPKLRSRLGPVLTPLSRGSHQTSSARSHVCGPYHVQNRFVLPVEAPWPFWPDEARPGRRSAAPSGPGRRRNCALASAPCSLRHHRTTAASNRFDDTHHL